LPQFPLGQLSAGSCKIPTGGSYFINKFLRFPGPTSLPFQGLKEDPLRDLRAFRMPKCCWACANPRRHCGVPSIPHFHPWDTVLQGSMTTLPWTMTHKASLSRLPDLAIAWLSTKTLDLFVEHAPPTADTLGMEKSRSRCLDTAALSSGEFSAWGHLLLQMTMNPEQV